MNNETVEGVRKEAKSHIANGRLRDAFFAFLSEFKSREILLLIGSVFGVKVIRITLTKHYTKMKILITITLILFTTLSLSGQISEPIKEKYFAVFGAVPNGSINPRDGQPSLKGHAFAGIGKYDNESGMCSIVTDGNWPDKIGNGKGPVKEFFLGIGITLGFVYGTGVPGTLQNDFAFLFSNDAQTSYKEISAADYDRADAVRQAWLERKNWSVYDRDCVTYFQEIAKAVRMEVLDRKDGTLPMDHFKAFSAKNNLTIMRAKDIEKEKPEKIDSPGRDIREGHDERTTERAEKAEREKTEKAERERADREKKERAEKAEREKMEKAEKEKKEREKKEIDEKLGKPGLDLPPKPALVPPISPSPKSNQWIYFLLAVILSTLLGFSIGCFYQKRQKG